MFLRDSKFTRMHAIFHNAKYNYESRTDLQIEIKLPGSTHMASLAELVLAVSARAISPRTQEIEDGKRSLETCKVDVWRENY